MAEIDPYAPPKANLDLRTVDVVEGEVRRVGERLITSPIATLPDRCVKCNGDTAGYRLKKTLYWHHPGFYAFLLMNLLIYALIASIARKKAVITFGLCPQHRLERKNALLAGWGLVLASFVWLFAVAGLDQPLLFLIFPVLFLAGIIFVIVKGNALRPERIDKTQAVLRGAGPAFLDSLG